MSDTNPTVQKTAIYLGYAGLIPMIFLAAVSIVRGVNVNLVYLFVDYSVGILCFMGGTLWGLAMGLRDKINTAHLAMFTGIAVTLGAISARLQSAPIAMIVLLAFGFAIVLLGEGRSGINDHMPDWYKTLRRNLSFGVLACHAAIAFKLFTL